MSQSDLKQQANISTIYHLLDTSNTQYRVFDLGRRVSKIAASTFKDIEDLKTPYPFPFQGHALIGIAFWDKSRSDEQFIWFLKFPLDEQGLLNPTARNHFITMVIQALGTQITGNQDIQEKLNNNPYTFKPNQHKSALFNSLLKVSLKLPASIYYEHVEQYMKGQHPWDDWSTIGYQGIADFASRIDRGENEKALLKNYTKLATEVRLPLLSCLENQTISTQLTELFSAQLKLAIENQNITEAAKLLSAMAGSQATALCYQAVMDVLDSPLNQSLEILATIAGRLWHTLENSAIRTNYLNTLAQNPDGQAVFNALFADLTAIPSLRELIWASIRSEDRTPALSAAVGGLFTQPQGNPECH
ncbi:DUF3549 family protein [Algicola sagamiensis]|uniref:DUF3549 family protein n=1 Tax=Algicola sagamiensis TaxID=163869 RepID=UPI000360194D|nr:DUF3549 family protein [Algicola sagamiensis]